MTSVAKPALRDLGYDLLALTPFMRALTIVQPLAFFGLYFVLAFNHYWAGAVICTIGLSFTTYGSTSHDLVHANLRLNKTVNTALLSFIEGICFRSGHAYKLSHLHHHKVFPDDGDIEGRASRMTLARTLLEGVMFQGMIYRWALMQNTPRFLRIMIIAEGVLVSAFILGAVLSTIITPVFLVYAALMIAGSWIIPLITSYAVHVPQGSDELRQTRLFRGRFFSLVAFDHLYHLEHHLYPMVPHKNWPKLAKRLDHFFAENQVKPISLFNS
jgi:beta-carotene hydroxylase